MSMPRRSRSRIAASVLQAGPMVQIILARRTALYVAGFSSGFWMAFNSSSMTGWTCLPQAFRGRRHHLTAASRTTEVVPLPTQKHRRDVACYVLPAAFGILVRETLQ